MVAGMKDDVDPMPRVAGFDSETCTVLGGRADAGVLCDQDRRLVDPLLAALRADADLPMRIWWSATISPILAA